MDLDLDSIAKSLSPDEGKTKNTNMIKDSNLSGLNLPQTQTNLEAP